MSSILAFSKLASFKIKDLANKKIVSFLLLFAFFYMVAAASHAGTMGKWGLRDIDGSSMSIISMIDGTADSPFVYRQLGPYIAKSLQPVISESKSVLMVKLRKLLIENVNPSDTFSKSTSADKPGYEYSYRIIYLTNFIALLITLFNLRLLARIYKFGQLESILAPTIFILALPYTQTIGGYFYDTLELAFFSSAILLAINARVKSLILVTIIATLNKESFLVFLPTLYPFLKEKLNAKNTIVILGLAILVAGLLNLFIKYIFQNNSGGMVYNFLHMNIYNYFFNMNTYLEVETTYGLPGPRGTFFTTVAIIFIIVSRSWHQILPTWKQHILIAAAINTPLFLAFCFTGEIRNLSLLFIGFVILIAGALKSTLELVPK